jgi:hypothetical protein
MTRFALGQSVVYRCDGPYGAPGGRPHAVVFVPAEQDVIAPAHWYTLLHGDTEQHFCDSDCLRLRLSDDYDAMFRRIHEQNAREREAG